MGWHKIIWIQPYRFTYLLARMKREHAAWHEFKVCVFAFTLNFMAIWLVVCLWAGGNPDIEPMAFRSALVFSAQCGLTMACIYQLHWLAPVTVVLDEEHMAIVGPNRQRWHYNQIACVRFNTVQEGARTFRVMLIVLRDGGDVMAGVPNRLDLARVIDFLKTKGVEIAETMAETAATV